MYFYLPIFFIGLVIGSFLNVVIFRFDKKIGFGGRSFCPCCKKKLCWYELVPVFSFLYLKGKCKGCSKKISWQYPLVELLTGVFFLLIYQVKFISIGKEIVDFNIIDLSRLFILWTIFSILIVISVYDIKKKIIPDSLSFLFAVFSFIFLFLHGIENISTWDFLAGPLLAAPFALLWFVSKGEWIGLGDSKLIVGIGWFLGLIYGISAIVLSFWIGSLFGIFLILLSKLQTLSFVSKNFTIKSEIPFAPFLILGTILVFFFGWDVLGLSFL